MKQGTQIAAPGLTALEYARRHGVTVDWIYKQVREGKLPHVKLFGRVFILAQEHETATTKREAHDGRNH
jgi:hypothetical protein